jgi:PAS domain S-box-containing protein
VTYISNMKKTIPLLSIFAWLLLMPDNLAFGNQLPTLNRTITVKGDRYYPPYEFINDQGEPDGFNVELFRELAKELQLSYHLELEPWDKVRPQLENKEIDVITGMMISEERAKKVLFGIPHSIITPGLFTRKNENINTIDDLLGKQVIVQSGDRMHDYLIENKITVDIIPVQTQMEALQMLNEGKYDAALIGNYQGAFLIKKMNLKNLTVKTIDIDPQKYAFTVNLDNEELLRLLNTGLYQLKANGTFDKLYEKWFAVYDQEFMMKKYQTIFSTIALVVGIMVLFLFLLRYQLKLATGKIIKQKNFLETLINTIPNPIVYIDHSQKIYGSNKSFEIFFKPPETNSKKSNIAPLSEKDCMNFLEWNNVSDVGNMDHTINERLEKRITVPSTGELRDVIIQEAALKNKSGNSVGIIGIITDITETKRIERELEIHRNQLERLIEERTAELKDKNEELVSKNKELARLNQLFVGREFRIKELKDKIDSLQKEIDRFSS